MSGRHPTLGETIVDARSIERRVAELAAAIDAHYAGSESPVVLLCVLKGALIFTADLARHLTVPCEIDFITVRSYGDGTESSGTPVVDADSAVPLRGRDVLIVEDIVDSGNTVTFLHEHLIDAGARSVRLAALLDKSSRREHAVRIDWTGFQIPDRFVVGYGLDHAQIYRNLADVRALDCG